MSSTLSNESLPEGNAILPDVNVLAVGLTESHPAHEYVWPWLREALDGSNVLVVPDYYPLRAQHIMTADFGVTTVEARNAIQSLLRSPARITGATEQILLDAYDISAEKNHDVYDSFVLAMALAHDATTLLTTDVDFDALCSDEDVTYRNPVPADRRDHLSGPEG